MSKKKYIPLGGSKNPVGYCAYHKATLSVKQLKSKECLSKNCNRLIKYQHDYWIQREKEKERKQYIKQQKKMREKKKKNKNLEMTL